MHMQFEDQWIIEEEVIDCEARHQENQLLKELYISSWEQCQDIILKMFDHETPHLFTKLFRKFESRKHEEVKRQFETNFNAKFIAILKHLPANQRYFQSKNQNIIASFLQKFYLQEHSRILPDSLILEELGKIGFSITHHDDFKKWIDILKDIRRDLRKRKELNQVFTHLFRLLQVEKQEESQPCDLNFAQSFKKLNPEQKLIIRIEIIYLLRTFNLPKLEVDESEIDKICEALRENPYEGVLTEVIKKKENNLSKELRNLLIKNKIICNYEHKLYRFETDLLHSDLCGTSTVIEVLKSFDKNETSRIFSSDSITIYQNQAKLKWNYEILQILASDSADELNRDREFEIEMFGKFINAFRILFDHKDKPYIAIKPTKMEEESFQEYNIKYICKVFDIISSYFCDSAKDPAFTFFTHFTEGLMVSWLKEISKWLENKTLSSQPFLKNTIENIYKIFGSIIQEEIRDFPNVHNPESDLSKGLIKILLINEDFPSHPIAWKSVKNLLLKWTEQMLNETEEMKTLISKLLQVFFKKDTHFGPKSARDAFNPITPISRSFVKMFSSALYEIMERICKEATKISNDYQSKHPAFDEHQQKISKVLMILSSRIRFDNIGKLATIVRELYEKSAHVYSSLYCFRFWILSIDLSKESSNEAFIEPMIDDAVTSLQRLLSIVDKMQTSQLIGNHKLEENTKNALNQYYLRSYLLFNQMHLKKPKAEYSAEIYKKYFHFLRLCMNDYVNSKARINEEIVNNPQEAREQAIINQLSTQSTTIFSLMTEIRNQAKMVMRYYICNSYKMLTNKEETYMMHQMAQLLLHITSGKNENYYELCFFNQIAGFSKIKRKTNLEARQILGALQRGPQGQRTQFVFKLDQFMPINLIISFYAKIRPNFQIMLKYLFSFKKPADIKEEFDIIKKKATKQELQKRKVYKNYSESKKIVENLLFPAVNISGPCWINGKLEDKAKEDFALGFYYDQFSILTKEISEHESVECILELEQRSILSRFLDILKNRAVKINTRAAGAVEYNNRNNIFENRHRSNRNRASLDQIIGELQRLGYPRMHAEIAVENIDMPDSQLALEWLENNQNRLEEIVIQRTLNQSKHNNSRNTNIKRPEEKQKSPDLPILTYEQFIHKDFCIKLVREWIKFISKKLFSADLGENLEKNEKLKDILFLFMNNIIDQKDRLKQYKHLSEKMCLDLGSLDEMVEKDEKVFINKLNLFTSILITTFSQDAKLIKTFYEKKIHLLIISYLKKIPDGKDQQKIFQLINSTLPVSQNNQVISNEMRQYMIFLLDQLHRYKPKQKESYEILYKIAKTKDKDLVGLVMRTLVELLSTGSLKGNVFALLHLLLESDKIFYSANVELDIKGFIFKNYKKQFENYLKDKKEAHIEIDMKIFSISFPKYQKSGEFLEISKKLFLKRKNKNRFLYYDLSKSICNFEESYIAEQKFLSYKLSRQQQSIVDSLITLIINCPDESEEIQLIAELHKLLNHYKLLIPYVLNLQVAGKDFLTWLVQNSKSQAKKKYQFLLFLAQRNNLTLSTPENIFSIGDYASLKLIQILYETIRSSQENQTKIKWALFLCIYLSQLKNFSNLSLCKFSKESQGTFLNFMENNLKNASPIKFSLISQFLFIHYKKMLVQNLKRKFKFANSNEKPIQKEFLFISGFYNGQKIRSYEISNVDRMQSPMLRSRSSALGRLIVDQIDQQEEENEEGNEDEEQSQMEMESFFARRYPRRDEEKNQNNTINVVQYFMIPIQPEKKPKKEGQDVQQPMDIILEPFHPLINHTVAQILDLFAKVLLKHQQRMVEEENLSKQLELPKNQIKIEENAQYNLKIDEVPSSDINASLKKTMVFEKRIEDIVQLLNPKLVWQKKETKELKDSSSHDLSRRLLERINLRDLGEHRQEMLAHLERLVHHRHRLEEQQPVEVVNRPVNVTDIYQGVEEYIEPPVIQVVELEIKPQEINRPPIVQEINPILPLNEEIQPIVEINQIQEEMVIQSQPEAMIGEEVSSIEPNNNSESENAQEKIEIASHQIVIEQEQEIVQNQQQNIEESAIKPQQVSPIVIPMISEQEISHEIQEPESGNMNQIIEVPIEQNIQQVPPQRERQILTAFGLPQSFLLDAGLDPQVFDNMPEDMQQEQILQFLSQQGLNLNPNRQNNQGGQGGNQNPIVDQQNENVAFLASLDMQTRVQVLMEAAPEFLTTLPPEIRAEAENYRQRHLQQIIEEEDLEEERNYQNNQKLNKVPLSKLIYPDMKTEEFSEISDEVAKFIITGIFIKFPKFKISGLKILLENKKTQTKTIATFINILRNVTERQKINFDDMQFNEEKQEWHASEVSHLSKSEIRNIKAYLLHLIYENLRIKIYKDQTFLDHKMPYDNYYHTKISPNLELEADEHGFYPLFELLDLSIDLYPPLATEIIKKIKKAPNCLIRKIIEGIRKDKLPVDFYDNLQAFSESEIMKQSFSEEFPEERPPKIEVLGKILRYKFAQMPYLKRVHEEALQQYNQSYNEFLNQIFVIYTVESLQEIENLLIKHKSVHFEIIKYLYQSGRQLDKEPIGIILKKPHLLDFETKKFIFRNHPKIRRQSRYRLHIEVNRKNIFQQSYNQLMSRTLKELQGRINVTFVDEPGHDAGGLKREWFLVVSREIFNQNYALFQKSSSGSTYQPNPKSYINQDHLRYFKFIGRFVGKALAEKELIDAYFSRAFYKMILGQELEFKDLEQQDFEFYKSMVWLKSNKIDEDMYTFSYIYDNFGNKVVKDLIPGGRDITVTEENKQQFIQKYSFSKMRDHFASQIENFLEGFHEIIPRECISFFEAKQLELLISGVPQIDFEDFKKNTDYSGYTPTDQVIQWFWEITAEYTQEQLAKLVQFITGTSKIPMEGFSHLIGMNGVQRISIHKDPSTHQLPKSHTCFNQLDLPSYGSKELLKERLRVCLTWGSEGFGFM